MTTLTILHLTDLHRGLGGYAKVIYPNVEQILLEDLERMHERTGPWDLVCFTGDLVQSGGGKDGKEFEQFQEIYATDCRLAAAVLLDACTELRDVSAG